MIELINKALNILDNYKLDYSDIRISETETESIITKNKEVENLNNINSIGFGIRILYNGAWGFASSPILNNDELETTIKKALDIAKASSLTSKNKTKLYREKSFKEEYTSPYKIDPFRVSLDKKINFLLSLYEGCKDYKNIKFLKFYLNFIKQKQIFANTEGSIIKQEFIKTGAGITATAINDNDMQVRSYPASFGGDYRHAGYEFIEELNFEKHINRICQEAEELLNAPLCPSGRKDIILDGGQMSIQIHESIGHPIELDRVLGMELSFAGTSFLKISDINNLRYGSNIVSVYSDPTIEYGLGSYGFDDDGIKSKRDCIIENGIFKGFISSRETCGILNRESNASVKAQDWNYLPIIRISNINLEAGNWKLEDLIEDTKDGLYMETNKSWSIDDKRWNFQFGTEIAREIKNGKLGKIYKNPTYTDNTINFWNSCDAICNKDYWKIWGVPNCGKGQPMQNAAVGHGVSPARFRNIKVGVL